MRLRIDGTDAIRKHELMVKRLIEGQRKACPEAGEVVQESIREDLRSKILRPRESTGLLASEITYHVHSTLLGHVIGVGDLLRMRRTVPYWRLINDGGPIAVKAVPGFFVDIAGQRVPFDRARAPTQGSPSTDVFIYTPKGKWVSPGVYAGNAEAATQAPIMYIHKPIDPKHYFESGNDQAQPRVFTIFKRWFLQAFR